MRLLLSICLVAALLVPVAAPAEPVRIGLTPVILDDQLRFLERWQAYLERAIGREVRFVRRNSYSEVVDLALRERIDFAWICGFPYIREQAALDLLAVPVYQGLPTYEAYLIASADTWSGVTLADMRGGIFAFSDPNSNSGWLYPEQAVRAMGSRSEYFFARTFFTFSHRRVVEAVAHGLADAGAVDGYVWDTLMQDEPALVAQTRIIARSPRFGFPPIVATRAASVELREQVKSALFAMGDDAEGRELLSRLNLDGFAPASDELYDGIRRLARGVSVAP